MSKILIKMEIVKIFEHAQKSCSRLAKAARSNRIKGDF